LVADPDQRTPPAHDGSPSIAQAILEVSERAQALVREEIELAKAEMTAKARSLAKGAAVGAAAGVFVLAALILVLHGLAWLTFWAIPLGNDDQFFWGFFIVAGVLLLLGVVAGLLAARAFKRGTPPKPQMAIDEAKLIKQTVTSHDPEGTV
jgi:H+/Cl- antiporter ClcA